MYQSRTYNQTNKDVRRKVRKLASKAKRQRKQSTRKEGGNA